MWEGCSKKGFWSFISKLYLFITAFSKLFKSGEILQGPVKRSCSIALTVLNCWNGFFYLLKSYFNWVIIHFFKKNINLLSVQIWCYWIQDFANKKPIQKKYLSSFLVVTFCWNLELFVLVIVLICIFKFAARLVHEGTRPESKFCRDHQNESDFERISNNK